jgi:hypothetical protein
LHLFNNLGTLKMQTSGYTALPSDKNPGPLMSVNGYVIAVTGLHEEVSVNQKQ